MRRVQLFRDGKLIRETTLKFADYNSALFYINKILKWKYEFKILDANGIPF